MSERTETQVRQSTVTREGAKFELHVNNSLNDFFTSQNYNVRVLNGNEVFKDPDLKEHFNIPVRGFNKNWGDVDLVVKDLDTNHPIALISCKLSLHGRFSETLFYSKIYREKIPDLKVVFATPDKGRQSKPGIWQTEWGTAGSPTKDRAFAETFLDGVFIDNEYLKREWNFDGTTVLGGKIRPFCQLSLDIIRWKNEISGTVR
jgi:hypothetical protein